MSKQLVKVKALPYKVRWLYCGDIYGRSISMRDTIHVGSFLSSSYITFIQINAKFRSRYIVVQLE